MTTTTPAPAPDYTLHDVICFRKTRKAAEKYAQFCRENETTDWVYWVEPVEGGFAVRVRAARPPRLNPQGRR